MDLGGDPLVRAPLPVPAWAPVDRLTDRRRPPFTPAAQAPASALGLLSAPLPGARAHATRDLLELVDLDHVARLQVVEALEPDAALVARPRPRARRP